MAEVVALVLPLGHSLEAERFGDGKLVSDECWWGLMSLTTLTSLRLGCPNENNADNKAFSETKSKAGVAGGV